MAASGAGDLAVGIVDHPRGSPLWPQIEAFLEAGRARSGSETELVKENGLVWIVARAGKIAGAATAYVTTDGGVEVVLGGGKGLAWARELDPVLCRWARDEGAGFVRIIGRRGWARLLGMDVMAREDGQWVLERAL